MNPEDPGPARSSSIAHGPAAAPAPAPGHGPLDWFESWLTVRPHSPAVVSGSTTWSYRQLAVQADGMARALGGRIAPGDLVGVRLERSPLLVAAALALARLGAVYLPLGTGQGTGRLGALADDAGLSRMLSADPTAGLPGWHTRPLDGIHLDTRTAARGEAHPDACYAVTTSGSTGTPKVVLVPESALANLVAWHCDRVGLGPGSRVSLLIDSTFDPHLMELWSALSSGAALHVAPHDVRSSPSELEQWWREQAITHCVLPTPLAELMLSRPWPAGLALRHLSVGGDRMRTRPPVGCTAVVDNLYGPAEATVVATAHRVRPAPDGGGGSVPIGTPVSGVTLYVTGPDGRLLPRGEPGELLLAGAGLALGYADPHRTAERFGPGPEGPRAYRTGDRAVMRADGVVEYLGRLDDQVKISGVRIEPGEVEAALEAHPSVRQAVALPVPDADGGLRLAAFLRLTDGAQPDAAAVLRAARARLLPQAVPALVRFVERFPLNANGKVDRPRLLRELPTAPAAPERSAPDEVEEFLVQLCRSLLDQPDLTARQNFTEAGGTSLAAARLLTRIEATYRIRVRAAELMRQPDLRALAALITARRT